jgi:eukaryotic-like serine/threonine-protein kinase
MSNERFFRCPICHLPHSERETICPTTQEAIVRPVGRSLSIPTSAPNPDATDPLPGTERDVPAARTGARLVGTCVDDKYVVKFILGRGGMGTVFEADQISVGRRVAFKVLHVRDAKNELTLRRFLQEATVAASLPHTNICQIYDYGSLPDGSPYIVMERLEGESLAERLRWEGPMNISLTLEIASQVLAALSFAHRKGVVHRDVKPENIFLAKVGRNTIAKLVDFGLSKVIRALVENEDDDMTPLTKTGVTMGTPYYMAPEQAFGDRTVDARADLWAVGITIYECIGGQRPFRAKGNFNLMKSIVSELHAPLCEIRAPLPDGLEAIVTRALAKNRDDRYQTASAFQRDIAGVLRAIQTQKRAPNRPT